MSRISTNLLLTVWLLTGSAWWTRPASAENVRFDFTGSVQDIFDGLGALDDSVLNASTFNGFYIFDSTTPNTAPPVEMGEAGLYHYDAPPAGVEIQIGDATFRSVVDSPDFDIIVNNDVGPEGLDQYGFSSIANEAEGISPSPEIDRLDLAWLASTDQQVFDSAELPTTPPDLAVLGGGDLNILGECTTCQGPSAFFRIQGTLTSLVDGQEDVCGDFDRDGDVDTADQEILTANWTGALEDGTGGKQFEEGDCDGDGDVDSADQTGLVRNWTGAMPAGNQTDGADADLRYDPVTGHVSLDGSDTGSGVLLSFVLNNGDAANFRLENLQTLPFLNTGTNTDETNFQIGQTDVLNQGVSSIDLGNVFPMGMDLATLSEYLEVAEYASALGAGGQFDLKIVPEPTGLAMILLGLVMMARLDRTGRIRQSSLCPPPRSQR